jgi:hypothetical protein
VVRTGGDIYYFTNLNRIYKLDEDTQYGANLEVTLPTPAGVSAFVGVRMYYPGGGTNVWCLSLAYQGAWSSYPVVYRYNLVSGLYSKVLDVYDETGYSHDFDSMYGGAWEWNKIGLVIPCTEYDTSEHAGHRGILLCSYDGDNWFEGYHDTDNDPNQNSVASLYPEPYRMVQKRSSYYTKYATTNFITWGNWPTSNLYGGEKLGKGLLGINTGSNPDQWLYTETGWLGYVNFKSDTGQSGDQVVGIGEGRYWSGANNGLSYWDGDQWILDYPNSLTAGYNIHDFFAGYTGHVFQCYYRGSRGYIYKRDRLGGGVASALGKGSVKLSIDRDSGHVYCTTYGIDTRTTDYWRVSSDLSEVRLIDYSTVSGIYGAVHSAENDGVYCYGNIDGDIVKRSQDNGLNFALYSVPSGLELSVLEASTLYTRRDNQLPDDIIITITISGAEIDSVYTYSGEWLFLSSGNFICESQVRRDEHTFLGVNLASGTRVVDYSSDSGYTWEAREGGLPIITINDLEFA